MPSYLAPGVYVEEVPSAIRPIAGVGTSTAGFIGCVPDNVAKELKPDVAPLPPFTGEGEAPQHAADDYYPLAPAGEPTLITSWEAFRTSFGSLQEGNRVLAHAVYGFFNNGGGRCYVTRIPKATMTLRDVQDALERFKGVDDIALVAVPGATDDNIQGAIVDHCEDRYLQDRFAILDGKQTATLSKTAIQGAVRDSSYGAVYYPWIDVGDKDDQDRVRYYPPSGHIAGVYARVDSERGVHKAPANEVIRGAVGVERVLSREDQAGLNPEDINVIRKFDGNITVWGAHTLAGKEDSQWRYVNVRRLFNFLRESIDEGTQWVVFEPNSPDLWSKIRRNVSAFLNNVWASGALFGTTPEQAFFVRCDESLNTSDVREAGQVVTEIGVAVVKPAEFVVFRISQWAGPGQ